MNIRFYAAMVTGLLSELLAALALWSWTSADVTEIIFWAIAAFLAGSVAVMWATEPRKADLRRLPASRK